MKTVAIVGVGLIGGSFALALRRAGFGGRIVGVSSAATIDEAVRLGVIERGVTLDEACATADLLYLAQPITRIIDTLAGLKTDALVTDAGSTKRAIVDAAKGLPRFLGGHPMAGKESRGVSSADAGLFERRTYVLTPREAGQLEHESEFVDWLQKIGTRVLVMTPEEHDQAVAFTSHLPQLTATALAAAISGHVTTDEQRQASGPGLIDTTRLALSPYEMWRDILATNGDDVDAALGELIGVLQALRADLHGETTERMFERGREFRSSIARSGPFR
jgi:prephenate dehydrogenase